MADFLKICLISELVFLLLSLSRPLQAQDNIYNHKNFWTYYEAFPNKYDLINFLDVKKGDVIAEVGAGNANSTIALSLLFDSVTLYAEDINKKILNKKKFNKKINYFKDFRNTPETNTFNFVIGTFTSTNLPNKTFDKIFLTATYHEFSHPDEMIADLNMKLKTGGKIYIIEEFSLPNIKKFCAKKHLHPTIQQVVDIMNKHGFYLVKMISPESNIVNYMNGLVFQKETQQSQLFYKFKDSLSSIISKNNAFKYKIVACDSVRMKSISDSLQAIAYLIPKVYSAYDNWLQGIGKKYMNSEQYKCAINIFKIAAISFPLNDLNYFYLALAFEGDRQYNMALNCYNKALQIEPANSEYKKRMDRLSYVLKESEK